ncbi:MAG: hypothetical protein LBG80_00055 [Bacteroidales bacterium]|jgi:hypothetical protein|nr:hypothetical protein [Bacteroidales bacterium]
MTKKKKKANLQAQQKMYAAQHKKQYMERLRAFCSIIGNGESLFELLPDYMSNTIYDMRGVTLKFKIVKDAKITKRFVKIMYSHIEQEMKNKYIDLMIQGINGQVNLVDYYQILLPLATVLLSPTSIFKGKEKFDNFCEKTDDRYVNYIKMTVNIIYNACYAYCDLSKRSLYTFTYESYQSSRGKNIYGPYYQIITLGTWLLDIRYVNIHGDRRPVIQTGEIRHNKNVSSLQPTTVPLKRLHVKDPSGSKKIPIYIQQHAVDRTIQRACYIMPGNVPSLIHKTFTNKNRIIKEKDKYLVECYDNDIKIGYFVGRLIDGIFVILTFLLITHSSTPEGRKLAELTGLQKEDMAFLAIDDLKTLINSDIATNYQIRKLFIDAGCESILQMNCDLHRGDYEWLRDETKLNSELSKLIAEYIQLGANDEDYFENE